MDACTMLGCAISRRQTEFQYPIIHHRLLARQLRFSSNVISPTAYRNRHNRTVTTYNKFSPTRSANLSPEVAKSGRVVDIRRRNVNNQTCLRCWDFAWQREVPATQGYSQRSTHFSQDHSSYWLLFNLNKLLYQSLPAHWSKIRNSQNSVFDLQ